MEENILLYFSFPPLGHEIRTIIDIIGAEVIHTMYNISLVTSDGRELACDWLRPAGGPSDPQFETTFTWPTEVSFTLNRVKKKIKKMKKKKAALC